MSAADDPGCDTGGGCAMPPAGFSIRRDFAVLEVVAFVADLAGTIFANCFACSFASLWVLVVKFNLIFFIPEVRLSISEVCEVVGSGFESTALLDLDRGSTLPSWPSDAELVSFKGDFRRTREFFGASARGCGGALVFLTTTGGIE
jgi:hypothetical protein